MRAHGRFTVTKYLDWDKSTILCDINDVCKYSYSLLTLVIPQLYRYFDTVALHRTLVPPYTMPVFPLVLYILTSVFVYTWHFLNRKLRLENIAVTLKKSCICMILLFKEIELAAIKISYQWRVVVFRVSQKYCRKGSTFILSSKCRKVRRKWEKEEKGTHTQRWRGGWGVIYVTHVTLMVMTITESHVTTAVTIPPCLHGAHPFLVKLDLCLWRFIFKTFTVSTRRK